MSSSSDERLRREERVRKSGAALAACREIERAVLDPLVEHVLLMLSAAALVPLGLGAFRAADGYVRVHGTVAQH